MFTESFGLKRNPFTTAPDPACLFLTQQHREALAGLTYAVLERKGFGVLTGDVGTGKTTILARMMQCFPKGRVRFSFICNPSMNADEFLELTMLSFGISTVPEGKARRLWTLQGFLQAANSGGEVCTLIIDEAHRLSPQALEEIRLLGNICAGSEPLIQILLVGQPELRELLNSEDLRQIKQRIAVRLTIDPLNAAQTDQYIHYRWKQAGGLEPIPFNPEATSAIARLSRGLPRLVNTLCDNALTVAVAEGTPVVSAAQVQTAARDLDLKGPGAPSKTAAEAPFVVAKAIPPVRAVEFNHSVSRPSFLGRLFGWA